MPKRASEDIEPKKFLHSLQVVRDNLELKVKDNTAEAKRLDTQTQIKVEVAEILACLRYVIASLCKMYALNMGIKGETMPGANEKVAVKYFPSREIRDHLTRLRGLVITAKTKEADADLAMVRGAIENTKQTIKRVKYLMGTD